MNVKRLELLYETEFSEINSLNVEIGMADGSLVKTSIENMNCPDQLRLALIPVLYTHQRLVYGHLQPVKVKEF